MVEEANPPKPLVSSHSRRKASSKLPQTSGPRRIMAMLPSIGQQLIFCARSLSTLPGECNPRPTFGAFCAREIRRFVAAVWRQARSSRSDDSRPDPLRCLRGSIRERAPGPASAGRSEISPIAMDWPSALFIPKKNSGQPPRQFRRNISEGHHIARTGGELDFEVISEVVMELLQRFDQQIVHREPDGSAPVRISAKEPVVDSRRLDSQPDVPCRSPTACRDGRDDTARRRESRRATGIRFRPA